MPPPSSPATVSHTSQARRGNKVTGPFRTQQEQLPLRRMAVDVRSAVNIEARSVPSMPQQLVSPSSVSRNSMANVRVEAGPPSRGNSHPPMHTPYTTGDVVNEGINTLFGTASVLNALPSATGVQADGVGFAGLGATAGMATLGWGACGFAIYQQSKQINKLQQAKTDLDKVAEGDIKNTQIRRLDDQIQNARLAKKITIGVLSTSMVLGGTTIGLSAAGVTQAATATGAAMGGFGILLSGLAATLDGVEIHRQSKANERLKAGLADVRQSVAASNSQEVPARQDLTDSLQRVAEHAKTAGQSRKAGKWVSLGMNVLNGLTGVATVAFKFLVAGSAAAVAGTVLLATGGVLVGAAVAFGIYKGMQRSRLKKAAQEPLRDLTKNPEAKAEHEVLLSKNKYYALKQFVVDLQRNASDVQKSTTVAYFATALNLTHEKAEAFYAELKNPDTSTEATQILADGLFRAKPVLV